MIAYRNRPYLIKAAGGLTTLPAQPATALLRQDIFKKCMSAAYSLDTLQQEKGLKPWEMKRTMGNLIQFREMLKTGDYVILDTETTGLDNAAQICQIAIIDSAGCALLNTMVKPVDSIPLSATRIHGITDEMVKDAPNWKAITPVVEKILTGRNVVIYNAAYDRRLMYQSGEAHSTVNTDWKNVGKFWCAMLAFSQIYGDWSSYHQNYRWQPLATAAAYYGYKSADAHNALGDCIATLEVCRGIVEDKKGYFKKPQ